MNFDEIKARHEKDTNEAAEVSARHGQPVIMGQNHADRAWLIAEVERLRELCAATQKALQIANTGMARMTLRKVDLEADGDEP